MEDNTFYWIIGAVAGLFVGVAILAYFVDHPDKERHLVDAHGDINPAMNCPHCQSRGLVRTKLVTQKGGISGTKATAALFTAGVSLFATGLAKKSTITQAYCQNCSNTWSF